MTTTNELAEILLTDPPEPAGQTLTSALDVLQRNITDGLPIIKTIPTGWELVDSSIGGLVRGEYFALVAKPGCGKSTLADNVVVGALQRDHNLRAIVFNMETATAVRVARIVASESVTTSTMGAITSAAPVGMMLRGELREIGVQAAGNAITRLRETIGDRLRFVDDRASVEGIANIIEDESPDVVLVDHVGLLHVEAVGDNETGRLDGALARLVRAFKRTQCAALLINEIDKAALSSGKIDLASSRGSIRLGSLAAAYVALAAQPRPDRDTDVVAVMLKSRFGPTGQGQQARFMGGLASFSWGDVLSPDQVEELLRAKKGSDDAGA